MPGTQVDAAGMIATALEMWPLPSCVMEALGVAGDLIEQQHATIERLTEVVKTAHRVGFQHGLGPCVCEVCKPAALESEVEDE